MTRSARELSYVQRVLLVQQRRRDIWSASYALSLLVSLATWAYFFNAGMLTHREKFFGFIGCFIVPLVVAALPSLIYQMIGRWSLFDETEASKIEKAEVERHGRKTL